MEFTSDPSEVFDIVFVLKQNIVDLDGVKEVPTLRVVYVRVFAFHNDVCVAQGVDGGDLA